MFAQGKVITGTARSKPERAPLRPIEETHVYGNDDARSAMDRMLETECFSRIASVSQTFNVPSHYFDHAGIGKQLEESAGLWTRAEIDWRVAGDALAKDSFRPLLRLSRSIIARPAIASPGARGRRRAVHNTRASNTQCSCSARVRGSASVWFPWRCPSRRRS